MYMRPPLNTFHSTMDIWLHSRRLCRWLLSLGPSNFEAHLSRAEAETFFPSLAIGVARQCRSRV